MKDKKTRILSVLVKPIGKREPESAMLAFDKLKKVIISCKDSDAQLQACLNLLRFYALRFPDHKAFFKSAYYKLAELHPTGTWIAVSPHAVRFLYDVIDEK